MKLGVKHIKNIACILPLHGYAMLLSHAFLGHEMKGPIRKDV